MPGCVRAVTGTAAALLVCLAAVFYGGSRHRLSELVLPPPPGPEVELSAGQGRLRGETWTSHGGRQFAAFTSIPYAK